MTTNNKKVLKFILSENEQNILLEDTKTGKALELTSEEFIEEFGLDEIYEGSPLGDFNHV